MASSYYVSEIDTTPSVEVHRLDDREDGIIRFVVWTDSPPETLDLSSEVPGMVAVTDHTGAVTFEDSSAIAVGADPLVIVARAAGVPTISEWGMIAMTLLLAAAGGFILVRRLPAVPIAKQYRPEPTST